MLIFLAYPPHLPTLKGREMALPQFAKLISLEVVSILMLAILMLVYLCIYHLRIMILFYWSVIYGCIFDPSFNYLLFCIRALFIVPFKQEPRPPSKHIDDLG